MIQNFWKWSKPVHLWMKKQKEKSALEKSLLLFGSWPRKSFSLSKADKFD